MGEAAVANESQKTDLTRKIGVMCASSNLSDVTLTSNVPGIPNAGIKCHKVILACGSEYFCEIFSDREAPDKIKVPVPHEVLKELVSFMYSGECTINVNNIVGIFESSVKWKLNNLTNECLLRMKNYMCEDNVVLFYKLASNLNYVELYSTAQLYIREHMDTLQDSLNELPLDDFYSVLDCPNMNMRSEDMMFKIIVNWIEKNPTDDVSKLYKLIDFENLSKDFVCDVVMCHPLMQASPQVNYVRDAIKYYFRNSNCVKCSLQINGNVSPSFTNKINEALDGSKGSALITCVHHWKLNIYDYVTKKWNPLLTLVKWVDECSAISIQGHSVLVGGANNKHTGKQVCLYDLKYHLYPLLLPELPCALAYCSLIKTDDIIYILGGQAFLGKEWTSSTSMYRLKLNDGFYEWEEMMPLIYAVSFPLIAHLNNFIYVLGGYDYAGKPMNYLQAYNTTTMTWKTYKPMPKPCFLKDSGVLVYNNKVTVLTTNMMMTYDHITNSWDVVEFNSLGRTIRPLLFKNELAASVFTSGKYYLYIYDHLMNTWILEDAPMKQVLGTSYYYNL